MTAPARISQADMDRAAKSIVKAGIARARIVMDLLNGRIEIIIGADSGDASTPDANPWDVELEQ